MAKKKSNTASIDIAPVKPSAKQSIGVTAAADGSLSQPDRGFITYSIRLDDQQRDWLVKAAALRGWTPTQLIRSATVDTSRHILNTARLTKFNFKALANEVADHLFNQRIEYATGADPNGDPDWEPYDPMGAGFSIRVQPEPMTAHRVADLKQATRLGGGEFLNLILDFCDALTASQRSDVPEPIDVTGTDAGND